MGLSALHRPAVLHAPTKVILASFLYKNVWKLRPTHHPPSLPNPSVHRAIG